MRRIAFLFQLGLVLTFYQFMAGAAFADHGPGTTGAGAEVQSADVVGLNRAAFSLRWDFTQLESLTSSQMETMVVNVDEDHAHVDALRWASLVTLDFAYGVTERFQLSISTGWYRGDDLREAHVHGDGSTGFHELGDVTGMTDLWVRGKYLLVQKPWGKIAPFAGIKLPIGRDDVRGEGEDEPLEPSLQPGTGAFDFMIGAAYTVWLVQNLSLDVSAQHIFRTENDDFQMGDRFDGGVRLSYRILGGPGDLPRISIEGEAAVRYIGRVDEDGNEIENTGGTILFLAPGLRTAFTEQLSLWVSPRFPAVQELNGEQQDVLFQVATELVLTF